MNEEKDYVIEKRKSKVLIFMSVLTCLVIIGTCIYFIFNSIKTDNSNSKKENNSEVENKVDIDNSNAEIKELEVTEEDKIIAQGLTGKFKILNESPSGINPVLYEKDITLSTDLNNAVILELAMYQYTINESPFDNLDWGGKGSITVASNKIKNYVTDIFGENFVYKNADIPDMCFSGVHGLYDSNNDVYIFSRPEHGCGGMFLPYIESKIIQIKKYNDRIEITERIAYLEYLTYEDGSTPNQLVYNNPTDKRYVGADPTTSSVDIFDKYSDKLTSYKWTFKKNESNYYFDKIEKLN